ncbi:MAG: DsbA family protein [Acetobacteraceae bacterium]|nr:DsbA family protein [Acetobacteraceae bacterium]
MKPAVGALLPVLFLTPAAAADQFTPAQRAEIVQIMRDALKRDPGILREAIDALQAADAKQREEASRAAIAASRSSLIDPADPVAGNPAGDVTIVEFFDARCPYCKRLEPTMTEFLGHDPGVRLVYKDMPILGAPSLLASKALLAAQRQGGYEKLRDALMRGGSDVSKESIKAESERLGLDWSRLEHDMNDPAIARRLDGNLQLARKLGIQGTPALVVGDDLLPGAADLPELQKAVAAARKEKG